MENYVQIQKHYIDIIIDAMEYAKSSIFIYGADNDRESEDFTEKTINEFKSKFSFYRDAGDADGSEGNIDASGSVQPIEITEHEMTLAYDSILKYKKHLKSTLSRYKKGSAQYNKTKKALDTIPYIISKFFSSVDKEFQ